MSSSGRYIGNPLFEATGSGASSTQTTSKSSGFFQDISDSANASVNSSSARRQAFSFAYSADSDSATAETTSRHHLRNQHHLPFSLDSPLDGVATASSRYLGVPNSYSSNIEATRFSLDSLPHSSRESNKLSFSRHHSVDSPEHVRRSQFSKSRQHHVSELLRDFQRHSGIHSVGISGGGLSSESSARLLDDDDYGQLYIANSEEESEAAKLFLDHHDTDVPGPAPEVAPPRPAPGDRIHFYDKNFSDYPVIYRQRPKHGDSTSSTSRAPAVVVNRDLNDNYNQQDNQQQTGANAAATSKGAVAAAAATSVVNFEVVPQKQQQQQTTKASTSTGVGGQAENSESFGIQSSATQPNSVGSYGAIQQSSSGQPEFASQQQQHQKYGPQQPNTSQDLSGQSGQQQTYGQVHSQPGYGQQQAAYGQTGQPGSGQYNGQNNASSGHQQAYGQNGQYVQQNYPYNQTGQGQVPSNQTGYEEQYSQQYSQAYGQRLNQNGQIYGQQQADFFSQNFGQGSQGNYALSQNYSGSKSSGLASSSSVQQNNGKQEYWKWNHSNHSDNLTTSNLLTSNGGLMGPHASFYGSNVKPSLMSNNTSFFYNNGHNTEQTAFHHVLPAGVKNDLGVNLDLVKAIDDPTTFFNDGIRKIDFVLVYEESAKDTMDFPEDIVDNTMAIDAEFDNISKGLKKRQKFSLWRQKFMASLQTIGLEIEEEVLHRSKNTLHFIRMHGPWPLLCRYAEELNLRAPIQPHFYTQAHPNPSGNWSEWILSALRLPNAMSDDVPKRPLDYYTCPFKSTKIDKFLGCNDTSSFFSRAQRSRMVYEILATTPFGKEKKGEVGIERMVEEGAYSAAFPLHDGPFEHPGPGTPPSQLNTRQILYEYWARWGKWYKYQPLDHIREYFGEKIAIYFAWLGFYTGWLLPAAVVGVMVFLYGVFTMNSNTIAVETCSKGDEYRMCPLCEECDYWKLIDICLYKRIAYLFDHPGTVFYAIFMSFWAVTFLEYWKRKSASLAHHWDCMGFQEEEERPRPAFAAKAPYLEKNPITGVKEPSFPAGERLKRIAAGSGIILLMIFLVLIFILAVIIYRTLVQIPLFQNETFRPVAPMVASMTGALVNLVFIMMLGRVYEKLALKLTTWEMHRTQSEFDDNLTFKVFLFQFINFYASIFYIAFFKGRFVGYPGRYMHIFGTLRNEDCSNGGCLIELAQQLAVIMVGKQIINNAQEILIPKLKAWWHNKKSKLAHIGESRMEKDYKLVENEGLFQEYLEMVLQFGFITIFVAAFPLAPFFALLNNWVEIRLDAQKFVCETRRAVAERAENIGIWFKILDMLAQFAVITNAFLIAFTSEFIPKLVYKYEHEWNMTGYVNFTLATSPYKDWGELDKQECRYRAFRDAEGNFTPTHWKILAVKLAFVICFEHAVFGVCRLIDLVVPDIPESLDVKIKRERYLAKEALQDADHVLQKVLTDHDSDRDNSDPEASANASPMTRKRAM